MAALGAGLLGVCLGAAGKLSTPGPMLVELGRRNWRAAPPLQRLLLSLSVEGHAATVTASSLDGPEGAEKRTQVSEQSLDQSSLSDC